MATPKPCAFCGAPFAAKRRLQKYCSISCRTGSQRASPRSRLEKIVQVSPEGCWLWGGPQNRGKYHKILVDGRLVKAHRFAYVEYVGPIGAGLCVCHRCDEPACCNPDHLFLGTQFENMADRDRKGRRTPRRGTAHSNTTLTEADVRTIRDSTEFGTVVAARFGISTSQVSHIRTRKQWAHLP